MTKRNSVGSGFWSLNWRRAAKLRNLTIGASILAVGVGCSGAALADATRGHALSQEWCSQCHGIAADEGSPNPDAPRFVDVAAEPSTTEYSLRVFLRTPHPTMPNFVLNPTDIEDIASYIISLKPSR